MLIQLLSIKKVVCFCEAFTIILDDSSRSHDHGQTTVSQVELPVVVSPIMEDQAHKPHRKAKEKKKPQGGMSATALIITTLD